MTNLCVGISGTWIRIKQYKMRNLHHQIYKKISLRDVLILGINFTNFELFPPVP